MRRTEKQNCPAGMAGTILKARVLLSEAAQHLSAMLCKFPVKPSNKALRDHLGTWSTVMIGNVKMEWSVNLCRRHAAWSADDLLVDMPAEENPEQQYVDVIYPNCPLDEDTTLQFDGETGIYMWRCAPTEADEIAMDDTLGHMLSIAGDENVDITPEFEKQVSQAQEHHYWPELVKNAFAGPEFIRLIGADQKRAGQICAAWVEKSQTTKPPNIDSTRLAIAEVDDLCVAVLGFLNSQPNNDASHEAMGKVFGANAELTPWLGTIVSTFRQSEGWDVVERDGLRARGFEKKHRDAYFVFKRELIDDTNIKDLMEKLPVYCSDKGFRPGQAEGLEEKAFNFIEGRIKELADLEPDAMQPGIRKRKLQALSKCLDFWSANPDLADEVSALQNACGTTARALEATTASSQVAQEVDENNVFEKVLGERLEKMVGHTDGSMTQSFVKLNNLFVTKARENLAQMLHPSFETLLGNWATFNKVFDDKKLSHYHTVWPIFTKSRNLLDKHRDWKNASSPKDAVIPPMTAAARIWDHCMVKALEDAKKFPGGALATTVDAVRSDEGINAAMHECKGLMMTKRRAAKETFAKLLEGYEQIAGGLKNKGNWKDGLTKDSSREKVIEHGKILTSGPGAQVLNMKKDIDADSRSSFHLAPSSRELKIDFTRSHLLYLHLLMSVFVSWASLSR